MASLSNIMLTIATGPTENTAKVTVSGTMTFNTNDIGKNIRMAIRIYGEDKPGDALAVNDPIGNDLLYTFMWHAQALQEPYKEFNVATAGPQPFSEARVINRSLLDEDKGLQKIGQPDLHTPLFARRKDEVYAWVSFLGLPISRRSPNVILTSWGV